MKLKRSTCLLATSVVFGLLAVGGNASAQSTWNLGGSSCDPGGSSPNSAVCTVSGVTATMTGWSSSGTGFTQGNLAAYDPSGFGVLSGSESINEQPQHAFDNMTTGCSAGSNCGGSTEAMLIGFGGAKVNLSSLSIGYWSGDADISVYRWDGTNGPNLGSSTISSSTGVISGGWTLVSSGDVNDQVGASVDNPNDTCTNLSDPNCYNARRFTLTSGINGAGAAATNNQYSSWWLISTYTGTARSTLESHDDAFKLLNFVAGTCTGTLSGGNGSTCTPPANGTVPEPATLALVGAALIGSVAGRKRFAKAA